jgi:hypothetical protein
METEVIELKREIEKLKRKNEELKMDAELVQLRLEVDELRRENTELKETNEKQEQKIDMLDERVQIQGPLVKIGLAIRRRWIEKAKKTLGIGEASKSIVAEGNEAAQHADMFADAAMWRLGYIKGSEPSSPLGSSGTACMENFKRVFLEVYKEEVDKFAVAYREWPLKQMLSAVEISNIRATFRLSAFLRSTIIVTEHAHYLQYRRLCEHYFSETSKIWKEHGWSKEAWPFIDSSPVVAGILKKSKETLSAIIQSKMNNARAKIA